MSVIPCEQDPSLRVQIEQFAEVLRRKPVSSGIMASRKKTSMLPRYSEALSNRCAENFPRRCEISGNSSSTC